MFHKIDVGQVDSAHLSSSKITPSLLCQTQNIALLHLYEVLLQVQTHQFLKCNGLNLGHCVFGSPEAEGRHIWYDGDRMKGLENSLLPPYFRGFKNNVV